MVSTRVYTDQIDSLLTYYLQLSSPEGHMTMENFAPLAKSLLLMIYQNTYPEQVRGKVKGQGSKVRVHLHVCSRMSGLSWTPGNLAVSSSTSFQESSLFLISQETSLQQGVSIVTGCLEVPKRRQMVEENSAHLCPSKEEALGGEKYEIYCLNGMLYC